MKTKKAKRTYSKISSLAWALGKLWRLDKRLLLLAFTMAPVSIALSLLASYFSKVLIDSIGGGAPFSQLLILVVAFTVATLVLQVFRAFLHTRCAARLYYPTDVYQREMSVFQQYETDYENTEKQDFNEIAGYAWTDASAGNCSLEFIWEDLSNTWNHLLGIVTYTSLLVALHPLIFAVVVTVSVLSYFTSRWEPVYYEKNKHKWEKESRKRYYLQGLSEDFPKAKDIKLYGLEPWLDRMMREYQAFLLQCSKRCSLRGFWASLLAGCMTLLQDGTAYLVLLALLLSDSISVGDFVFYFGITGSIAGFLRGIIGDVAQLNTRADKIAYYRDFFNYPSRFNHGKGCPLPVSPVRIELRDVWYRYAGAKDDTLKGINLVIEGGESLALVGVNGAGKTTLVKLLCGLYAPTKGEILVGGKRIQEYNIEEYYSLISAVFQEMHPIAFTMFEFVASADLDRPTARADAVAAMKAADIYERVSSLPNGIDTHLMKGVYDDGVDLSGGEMQKIALARALYKDAPFIILDEPTAALDPIAEAEIYAKFDEIVGDKTAIYISHRLSSCRFCDRIAVFDQGQIVQIGTHEELLADETGKYRELWYAQAQYYTEQ